MRMTVFVVGGLFLMSGLAYAQTNPQTAKATLANAQREPVGTATLTEMKGGVQISLKLTKLPPGTHALHIHEVDQCDPPDFKSAGGHFNPYGKKHGVKNPQGHHAGDLPNIVVGPDGTAATQLMAAGVTLGTGTNSLFHLGGTSLVIHASPDDDRTDPAGNAGARIACGVITQ